MKKVVVIGSGGSGKSTFSRQLGEVTGLPVVHLDQLYWHAGWVKTPADEWEAIVRRELEKPDWIMDGNFGGTRPMRLAACDTVIFLDLPRWLCIYRILKRTLTYRKGTRPDMAEGCDERFDPEFMLWVWNYPNSGRKRVVNELEHLTDKNIITLKTSAEVEDFFTRPIA
ncbi:MAG: DNA topology modulation protein [Pyrinomonadaceae bacterium]